MRVGGEQDGGFPVRKAARRAQCEVIDPGTQTMFTAQFAGVPGHQTAPGIITVDTADKAVVFYSPHAVEIKKLKEVTKEQIARAFQRDDLIIYTNPDEFKDFLF